MAILSRYYMLCITDVPDTQVPDSASVMSGSTQMSRRSGVSNRSTLSMKSKKKAKIMKRLSDLEAALAMESTMRHAAEKEVKYLKAKCT